jgi:hypothetical protein
MEGTTVTQPQTDPFGQADDFFGGGNPSISFKDARGVWKGGAIVGLGNKQQATDYSTKQPKVWPKDGTPIMVLPIRLQTDERNPLDPHDDGVRTLWIEEGSALKKAVGDALRAARSNLRPGGTLHVVWTTGEGAVGDAKQYQAQYTPAVPGAAGADTMFAAPAAPAQPAAPQWGTPPPAAPPAPAAWGQTAPPAPAPLASVPPAPAPQPATPVLDLASIEAAYSHLEQPQRAAIAAAMGQGMTVDQVTAIFGPPQGAAA